MKYARIIAATLALLTGLASPLLAAPEAEAPPPAKSVDDAARPGKAPWIRKSSQQSVESDEILDLFKIGGTGVIFIVSVLILGLMFGARRSKLTPIQRNRLAVLQAQSIKDGARASRPLATQRR